MNNSPPVWLIRFFRWFCHPDYVEDIEGDLHERFAHKLEESTPNKAKWRFLIEVLLLFRPGIIRPLGIENSFIHTAMFKHNILITYRSFLRDKTTFLINFTGLSTGLACVLMVYLWVNDELKVDQFHEKGDQIFQVMTNTKLSNGTIATREMSSSLLANAMLEENPDIETATMVSTREESPQGVLSSDENEIAASGLYSIENFFDVFSYKLIDGDANRVLTDKNHIVISQALALKLFNSTDGVVGKTLQFDNPFRKETFLVTGVFETPPSHSTEKFDFVVHIQGFFDAFTWANEWNATTVETFLVLKKGVDIERFNNRIAPFLSQKLDSENAKRKTLFIQNYADNYLYNHFEDGVQQGGRIDYIKLFSLTGLFILLIACINFMNLSTARASTKMKQIGVKKTLGATKRILRLQFLSESVLISLISLIFACGLVVLLLPQVNSITGKQLVFAADWKIFSTFIGITTLTGLIAGSYPAFFLSGLNTLSILKGKLHASINEIWVRKSLVIFQFSLSVIFIVAVLVINEQMEYIQNKNLGYDRDNILYFQRINQGYDPEVFLSEIRNLPGVENVTNIHGGSIVNNSNRGSGFSWDGELSNKEFRFMRPQVSYDFFETLDIKLLEGRTFSRNYGEEREKLIVNEAAAEMIGTEGIIGKVISDGSLEKQIVGVVKNFNIKSLHEKMEPCIIRFAPNGQNVMVKIKDETEQATIAQIQAIFEKFHPAYSFKFSFLDEEYQRLYEAENRVAALSKYFSILAIIISCLGLFGLAAFTAERRIKEIGIRKVLGASVWEITKMLSSDFSKMVGMAIVIALPLSYLIAQNWLQNFAFKIELQWWFFAGTAGITLAIAWITIAFQTLKTASINPVECLRDE